MPELCQDVIKKGSDWQNLFKTLMSIFIEPSHSSEF